MVKWSADDPSVYCACALYSLDMIKLLGSICSRSQKLFGEIVNSRKYVSYLLIRLGQSLLEKEPLANGSCLTQHQIRLHILPSKWYQEKKYMCVVPYFCEYKVYFILLFFVLISRKILKSVSVLSDSESSHSKSVDSIVDPLCLNGAITVYFDDGGETWTSGKW